MANWKRELDLKDVWQRAKGKEISLQELSGIIADRLEALRKLRATEVTHAEDADYFNMLQEEFVDKFRCMSKQADLDTEEFDGNFSELYDWGDRHLKNNGRVLWISTNC